ncbi:MAG: hypothetical protein QM737_20230 [Ferruginibacter sp.]
MLNEKYNSSWKSGLDQLSALPGEAGHDMNAVWEKLDTRLQKKQSDKKFPWYWVAAACVCGCMLVVSLLLNNKKENIQQEIAKDNITVNKKEIVQTPVIKETNVHASIPVIKKAKTPVQSVAKNVIIKSKTMVPVIKPVEEIIPEKKDSLIMTSNIPQTIKSKPIVFTSLKKKLPVVHINELEKPVQPVENVAGSNDRNSFRLRLFNSDIRLGSPEINNENSNAIKIKLSPQN